jgi:hypothetical protein
MDDIKRTEMRELLRNIVTKHNTIKENLESMDSDVRFALRSRITTKIHSRDINGWRIRLGRMSDTIIKISKLLDEYENS